MYASFHPLVHTPDGRSGQRWADLKLRAGCSFFWVSCMGAGLKVEQQRFKQAPIWHADTADYTIALSPRNRDHSSR